MSQRAHLWIRLVAIGVIVAMSCLPRGDNGKGAGSGAEPAAEVAHK